MFLLTLNGNKENSRADTTHNFSLSLENLKWNENRKREFEEGFSLLNTDMHFYVSREKWE